MTVSEDLHSLVQYLWQGLLSCAPPGHLCVSSPGPALKREVQTNCTTYPVQTQCVHSSPIHVYCKWEPLLHVYTVVYTLIHIYPRNLMQTCSMSSYVLLIYTCEHTKTGTPWFLFELAFLRVTQSSRL